MKIFTKFFALILTAILLLFGAPSRSQALLDPLSQPRFAKPLPKPTVIDAAFGRSVKVYNMEMTEFKQKLGLVNPSGKEIETTVWGYEGSYPGPTIIALRDKPIDVKWINNLPNRHLMPVDKSLHWANPSLYPSGGIPAVTHLHGGHTETESDGDPEAWFTRGYGQRGPFWAKKVYHYDNDQEAATLWYHDHALGITRLNVNAGLAGFYLLRDENELQLIKKGILPSGDFEREIVIQDRMFDASGKLFFPHSANHPGGEELPFGVPAKSAIAEFFGNFILVNGTIWPYMETEARKYRFRLLNGSDSRFYILQFSNKMRFLQIGTDDGLLNSPVELNQLVLAPGERADIVVNFSTAHGHVELLNFGPDGPFKGFNPDGTLSDGEGGALPPADPATTGQIMRFNVHSRSSIALDAGVRYGTDLRPINGPIPRMGGADKVRKLGLFEGMDEYGRLQPMLGIIDPGSKMNGSLTWSDPTTEKPKLNNTEIWEIFNATEDAHPIHLHLVTFQIINRESISNLELTRKEQHQHNGKKGEGGVIEGYELDGDIAPPAPNERGWKDTAIAPPGKVTRVIAKFDRPGAYVWHCHILSHEDHDMMRRFEVQEPQALQSISLEPVTTAVVDQNGQLGQNLPNPFRKTTLIPFQLTKDEHAVLEIFDLNGRLVKQLANGRMDAGAHQVEWDGRNSDRQLVPAGLYIYQLRAGTFLESKRLLIAR